MLDPQIPRLMIYLLSWMNSVLKYIYTKPPTYNTSPIVRICIQEGSSGECSEPVVGVT